MIVAAEKTERNAAIFQLWLGRELTQQEISEKYNITQQRVGQIVRKIIERERTEAQNNG